MDKHVQNLGTANILYGALGLLISIGVLVVNGNLHNIQEAFNEDIYGMMAVVLVLFHIVMAVPCIACGLFVKQYYDEARVGLIVVSALNLLVPPVGTALGAYGLWVLMTPESEPLFANAQRVRSSAVRKSRLKAADARVEAAKKKAANSILPSEAE